MVSSSVLQRPTVSAANTLQYTDGVHATAWLPASCLFAATPGSGGAITQVRFRDAGAGGSWFELDGKKIDDASITLSMADVSRLRYVAGTQVGTYRFEVNVADAQGNWSAGANGQGTVAAIAPPPVVIAPPPPPTPVPTPSDTVTLGNAGQTLTVTGVHTLIGGTGTDVVTLSGSGGSIQVSGVDTLIGSAGVDIVKLLADSASAMTTMTVRGIETLKGSIGIDTVLLGDAGATMTYSVIETLIGGSGVDVVRCGGIGATLVVSGIETLIGGMGTDAVTVAAGTIHYEIGTLSGDTLTLAAGNGADEVVFTGVAGTASQIANLQSGVDHLVLGGSLRWPLDHDADGVVDAAVRATGGVDASTDEVAFLSATVGSLTAPGYDAVRAAIGTLAHSSAGASVAVVAGNGVDTGLYMVKDADGNGQVGTSEIRLLGLLTNTPALATGDIVFG